MRNGLNCEYGRKKGFTLVELLVVISIIALLMSVLMPALSRAREQARAMKCASSLKQMGLGWQMYADENDGYFPVGLTWDAADPYAHMAWWQKGNGIADYMPSETAFDLKYEYEGKADIAYTGWYCPSHTEEAIKNRIAVGYHFNYDIGYYRTTNNAKISDTSQVPLLFGYWDPNPNVSVYDGKEYKQHLGNYFSKAGEDPPFNEQGYIAYHFTESVRSVHGDIGTNFLFVDGHTERITPLDSQEDYAQRFRWEIPQSAYKEIPQREGPSGW